MKPVVRIAGGALAAVGVLSLGGAAGLVVPSGGFAAPVSLSTALGDADGYLDDDTADGGKIGRAHV